MGHTGVIRSLLLTLLCASFLYGAPAFPELSGRVVDQAGLLEPSQEEELALRLKQHEAATGDQVVVVTLESLGGYEIADYGYQLGRHWGIGQKGKDNGVLLIVAPNERKVRIEVGYGLEGTLTDKLSHDIIQDRIIPRFKENRYDEGIVNGVHAILALLGGETLPTQSVEKERTDSGGDESPWSGLIFFVIVIVTIFIRSASLTFRLITASVLSIVFGTVVWFLSHALMPVLVVVGMVWLWIFVKGSGFSSGSGGSWSGGGSGGFSGGGGSFGGGGASGGW